MEVTNPTLQFGTSQNVFVIFHDIPRESRYFLVKVFDTLSPDPSALHCTYFGSSDPQNIVPLRLTDPYTCLSGRTLWTGCRYEICLSLPQSTCIEYQLPLRFDLYAESPGGNNPHLCHNGIDYQLFAKSFSLPPSILGSRIMFDLLILTPSTYFFEFKPVDYQTTICYTSPRFRVDAPRSSFSCDTLREINECVVHVTNLVQRTTDNTRTLLDLYSQYRNS